MARSEEAVAAAAAAAESGERRSGKFIMGLPHLFLALLGLACLPGVHALPSLLSNCSYSYGTNLFGALREQERRWSQLAQLPQHSPNGSALEWAGPTSILGLSPLPAGGASLKKINVGLGTTGTTDLFNIGRKSGRYASGCHWLSCFNHSETHTVNLLMTHYSNLTHCVASSRAADRQADQCRTQQWLKELRRLLLLSFSNNGGLGETGPGLELYADTPASFLFAEVLTLVPKVRVQHSLRDPFEWAIKRIEHPPEIMCRPGSMSAQHEAEGGALHILPCLLGSEYLYENLVNQRQYVIGKDKGNRDEFPLYNQKPLPKRKANPMLPNAQELANASEGVSEFNMSSGGSGGSGGGSGGGLTRGQQLRLAELGQWAAQFNQYVLKHSHPGRYEAICVWDRN
ncbi:hypothetical protein B484DRAFT_451894 [Ochromonadaceae sp. CCMP2298]|nr:hypothetical protein B484DRAFT_451894 [Ochromonadaceae sp. CCMP2298]